MVGEDELVEAPLDLAVRARGHALLDDEVGRGVAPQRHRGPFRGEDHLVTLHQDPQLRVFRLVDRLLRSERGHVLALLPDELVDLDLLRLALDLDRGDGSGSGLEHRRHQHHRVARGDDLSLGRHAGKARGEIYRVAKHVAIALDDRAVVEADADADLRAADRRQLGDGALHFDCCVGGRVGSEKSAHHLLTDGLDHPPLGVERLLAHQVDALLDGGVRDGVARRLVELGAAAHVGEQHRRLADLLRHLPAGLPYG